MKKSFVTLLALVSLVSVYQPVLADEDVAAHKTKVLAEIDERIQKMQEHRGCVSNAGTKEALHDCREKMKAWHQSEKKEHLEKKRARIDEKMQKLEAQKKALSN